MKRPGILTAICIIGIVLASLGGLGGLCGLGSAVVQLSGQQLAMDAEMQAFQQRWLPVSLTIICFKMVVVGLLFYGTISALRLAPHGCKWLGIAMWAGLIFEVGQIYPIISMQLQVFDLMKDDLMRQQPPGGPLDPDQFLELIKGMSIAMGVGLSLLKAGYYCWGIMYTSRESTRQLFARQSLDDDEFDRDGESDQHRTSRRPDSRHDENADAGDDPYSR